MVEKIFDVGEFKKLGLGKQQLVVLVHSGSRGLGEFIPVQSLKLVRNPGFAPGPSPSQGEMLLITRRIQQFAGIVPLWASSIAVRIRTRLITDPLVGHGRNPTTFRSSRGGV